VPYSMCGSFVHNFGVSYGRTRDAVHHEAHSLALVRPQLACGGRRTKKGKAQAKSGIITLKGLVLFFGLATDACSIALACHTMRFARAPPASQPSIQTALRARLALPSGSVVGSNRHSGSAGGPPAVRCGSGGP
jgi:hypothetical protein